MADAFVFDMPVELRLELMAVISPDFPNAKRKGLDDVVDEVDGAGLSMFRVYLERPHPPCVINCRELEATDFLSPFSFEGQELDVHLNVMTGNLLVVSLGVNFSKASAAWKPVDAISLEGPGNRCV